MGKLRFIIMLCLSATLFPGHIYPAGVADSVDVLMQLAGNIHQFNKHFPQEKVFLHFDNTAYFQGEVIWFKAFVTHASTLQRAPSKVLYVDLLSPEGIVIEQQKLKVVAGQCDGAFPLIDASTSQSRSLRGMIAYPSGYYEIRAYTQNMLDFSPEAFFSRVFPVLSKPAKDGDYASGVIVEPVEELLELEPIRGEENLGNRDIIVDFYPEGGSLIRGLPGNVAFKATDNSGVGLEGVLTLSDGTIKAETVHDGMGSFVTVPSQTAETVIFTDVDGNRRRFRLPSAEKSGYSMILSADDNASIGAKIYRTIDRTEDELGLSVICRGELVHFSKVRGADSVSLDIETTDWPVGVCRITLYNKSGEILSSRSLFNSNSLFAPPSITVDTDSLTRRPFGYSVLGFNLVDRDGNPIRDRFCLSVRDAADYGNGSSDNLMVNLLLSSDLKGYIRNPDFYLEKDDSLHRRALDLLTLVQGWERYEWKVMTGQTDFRERYRVEEQLNVNGMILSHAKRAPVADVDVLATVTPYDDKTSFESFKYTTDSTGYFGFNLSDFYNSARLSLRLVTHKRNGKVKYETGTRIQLDRVHVPEPRKIEAAEKNLKKMIPVFSDFNSDADERSSSNDTLPLVIEVDEGILLDEVDITAKRQFVDYDTYRAWDVARETELQLDKGEYTTDLYGYLLELGYHFSYPVIYYVHFKDRVPYASETPLTLDMMNIKSVLVYDKPMYRSHIITLTPLLNEQANRQLDLNYFLEAQTDISRYYLVDVLLKEPHLQPTKKDMRNLSERATSVQGFSMPVAFYSPSYPDGPVTGDVDYRRTLYWNPNVITDEEGYARVEFYNNSYSRNFKLTGAGITASGTPYVLDTGF